MNSSGAESLSIIFFHLLQAFTLWFNSLMIIFSTTCFSLNFLCCFHSASNCFSNPPLLISAFISGDSIFVNEQTNELFTSTKCFSYYRFAVTSTSSTFTHQQWIHHKRWSFSNMYSMDVNQLNGEKVNCWEMFFCRQVTHKRARSVSALSTIHSIPLPSNNVVS